jgi:hypothetical protein
MIFTAHIRPTPDDRKAKRRASHFVYERLPSPDMATPRAVRARASRCDARARKKRPVKSTSTPSFF